VDLAVREICPDLTFYPTASTRIQARAVRRCGELLKEYDGRGAHRKTDGADSSSQRSAAREAGMSERQQVTAVRVANVAEDALTTPPYFQ